MTTHRSSEELTIIGGGVAALWLALYASQSGVTTRLVADRFGGYASTGNQGWLHSGALYAINGAYDLAIECRAGAAAVAQFAAETGAAIISPTTSGAFVFENPGQVPTALERLSRCRIPHDFRSGRQVSDVHSLLPDKTDATVVVTDDRTIDTRLLISELVRSAIGSGVRLLAEPPPTRLERTAQRWRIVTDGETFSTNTVVLALGAGLPAFLAGVLPDVRSPAYRTTRSRVLALSGPLLETVVVSPTAGSLALVPLWQAGTVCGLTMCTLDANEPEHHTSSTPDRGTVNRETASALNSIPGLAEYVTRNRTTMGAYYCQKLITDGEQGSESSRMYKVDEYAPGLFGLYSGKMTAAPIAASACLDILTKSSNGMRQDLRSPADDPAPEGFTIASRPAHDIVHGESGQYVAIAAEDLSTMLTG